MALANRDTKRRLAFGVTEVLFGIDHWNLAINRIARGEHREGCKGECRGLCHQLDAQDALNKFRWTGTAAGGTVPPSE